MVKMAVYSKRGAPLRPGQQRGGLPLLAFHLAPWQGVEMETPGRREAQQFSLLLTDCLAGKINEFSLSWLPAAGRALRGSPWRNSGVLKEVWQERLRSGDLGS